MTRGSLGDMSRKDRDHWYAEEMPFVPGKIDHKSPRKTWLKSMVDVHKPSSIIDIACLDGYLVHQFALDGIKVTGYDINQRAIDIGNERGHDNAKYIAANFEYINESADMVISFDFIEHITKDDAAKLIEIMHNSANNICILCTPHPDGRFGNADSNIGHINLYYPIELTDQVKEVTGSDANYEYSIGDDFFYVWWKKQAPGDP